MNDLIRRQDAVDALEAKKDKSAKGDIGCFYNTIIQHDIDALKGLPSAQPKPKQITPSDQEKSDKFGVKSGKTCADTISRQAAIDSILECCTSDCDNEYECGYDDGLRKGVHKLKHLPSVQPESCEDAVSRQYAIEHYQHVCRRTSCKECPLHIQVTDTLTDCELELFLHNLPSAQIERKKGRWVYGESEQGNDGYVCTKCGNFVPWIYKEFDMDFIREFHFCPSCGAEMGVQE